MGKRDVAWDRNGVTGSEETRKEEDGRGQSPDYPLRKAGLMV